MRERERETGSHRERVSIHHVLAILAVKNPIGCIMNSSLNGPKQQMVLRDSSFVSDSLRC